VSVGKGMGVSVGLGKTGGTVGVPLGVHVGGTGGVQVGIIVIVAVGKAGGVIVGGGGWGHGPMMTIAITTITQARRHNPPRATAITQANPVHLERSQSPHPAGGGGESPMLVRILFICVAPDRPMRIAMTLNMTPNPEDGANRSFLIR
jgi:hypothetical protein